MKQLILTTALTVICFMGMLKLVESTQSSAKQIQTIILDINGVHQ